MTEHSQKSCRLWTISPSILVTARKRGCITRMARQLREQKLAILITDDGTRHTVVQERRPSSTYGKRFMTLFTDAMKKAAKTIKHGMTWRVLHLLHEHLDFTDFRQIKTVDLAAELDSDSGTISRAMRELLQIGILEREGVGARSAWRFSSNWGWNGTVDQYHAFRAGRMKGKKPPATDHLKSHNAYYGKSYSAPVVQATMFSTIPSQAGSTPAGRCCIIQSQSRSGPICVSTVRRTPMCLDQSITRSKFACVECGAR